MYLFESNLFHISFSVAEKDSFIEEITKISRESEFNNLLNKFGLKSKSDDIPKLYGIVDLYDLHYLCNNYQLNSFYFEQFTDNDYAKIIPKLSEVCDIYKKFTGVLKEDITKKIVFFSKHLNYQECAYLYLILNDLGFFNLTSIENIINEINLYDSKKIKSRNRTFANKIFIAIREDISLNA